MTTANLLNVSAIGPNTAVAVDAQKKLQEENLEVAEVFATMMNQTVDFSNPMVDDTSSHMDVSKADSTQTAADSYDRYSYKDNQIETAEEQSVSDKLDEAGVDMEQVEEEVVNTLSEEYGVSEEQIQDLLDEMGLTVLDLLNPQNLVQFVLALTGIASGEELLLDESFLSVMETIDNLTENLMKDLNVDMEGLQEIIKEFELVRETEVDASFQETLQTVIQDEGNVEATKVDENVSDKTVTVEVEKEVEETTEVKSETTEGDVETLSQESDQTSLTGNQNSEESSFANQNQNSNENILNANVQTNATFGQVTDTTFSQFTTYTSVDTVQIMQQIVEQMRVTISADTTSMEMQLNPENLGKVTVHVSSEEGVVNAQFTANNEIVKEALETQIATLRESLNQAGVKVDAIEVTIASHEFEQNLEQNQRNPEEEVELQQNGTKRRNLKIDSLDDLAGLMTEEEALVAQIMKDNGNSVDFTA